MQNFFSYPIVVEELTSVEKKYDLRPNAEELLYITDILKVPSVKSFKASLRLKFNKKAHMLKVEGSLQAVVEQQSVISLELFDKPYHADFELIYDTKATPQDLQEMEAELEDDLPDIVINGQIDLGEIAMEQLALILDDYPRKEGEFFEFKAEFDPEEDEKKNPFSVLASLKK